PYPQTYASFGSAVSGIGDINGDTVPDIAIGATHQRMQQGQVFVFSGANGSLLYAINNPYPTQIAIFGKAISGGGDLNGDARPDFVVGGYGIWNRWAGKLMVFSGKDGSLLYAKDDPNPVSGSFGDDVEMIGDVDGDSVADILVGAWEHEMAGQAFVYSGASGTLLYTLNHPNHTGGFYSFGRGLEGIGDISGDNIPDLVVGVATDDGADEMQGRAFVFSGADGSLLFPLENPEPKQEGLLGFSIADIGDYNGDRLSDIAVTALGNERTYIFSGADGSALASVGGGWQVINVGDITGDGYPDIATSNETTRRVALYSLHGDVPYKNLLRNPSYENGTVPWKFWTDGEATFTTESPGYIGDYAARIDIIEPGDNVQLYQKGFPLKAASYYRLEFAARSATGHDVALY
ncbi:MAG: FG-GAP repeat protein, partial [Caldilineaceae bacterium]|nr:FG-GAP repeat protein [Caldilineaceae bacterium]